MIYTSRELVRILSRLDDDFIIVKLGNKEYVIDSIGYNKIHGDKDNMKSLCINIRDGGEGNIKQ